MTQQVSTKQTSLKKTIVIVSATAALGALVALNSQNGSPQGTFLKQASSNYQAMLKFNQFLSDHNKHYITQEEFQARF